MLRKGNRVGILPYGTRHMDRSYLRFIPIADKESIIPMSLLWREDNENPTLTMLLEAAMATTGFSEKA